MKSTYYPHDDLLEIRISDKAVSREVSDGWNVNIADADDGCVVEIVLLDAMEQGLYPVALEREAA